MIIDCHAHLIAPPSLYAYRSQLLADGGYHEVNANVPEDELRASAAKNVELLDEVGTDIQLLSPRPYQQGNSMHPFRIVEPWIRAQNDAIARTVSFYPTRFAGVGGLPIVPDQPVTHAFSELERIHELGFVGVLLNPDPSEGTGLTPTLEDRYWYPLYEQLVDLDMPMHIHSGGCFSGRESYSEHFITEESIAVLSLLRGTALDDFPSLRIVVSHGGGSVPYQVGRWQAERMLPLFGGNRDSIRFEESLRRLFFDSVLHHPLALELLIKIVGSDRVLFGTERPGSGSAFNPDTGLDFDDLKPIIEGMESLSMDDRTGIFEANARTVFTKLAKEDQ